jgi:hypothetical protein
MVSDFLARMVTEGRPTLAAIGPIADVPRLDAVAGRFGRTSASAA